jgi:hypothetical protein
VRKTAEAAQRRRRRRLGLLAGELPDLAGDALARGRRAADDEDRVVAADRAEDIGQRAASKAAATAARPGAVGSDELPTPSMRSKSWGSSVSSATRPCSLSAAASVVT